MLSIAICDDKLPELRAAYEGVSKWAETLNGSEVTIETFSDASLLLKKHTENRYGILILDILMPGINGIEAARQIRRANDQTLIIYETATPEYAMDAFGIKAVGYVMKPLRQNELEECLQRAYTLYNARPARIVTIQNHDGIHKPSVDDIMYIENNLRNVVYTIRNAPSIEVVRRSGSFESIVEPVTKYKDFVQVHKSFFVNMKYIKLFNDDELIMDDGKCIPVAKRRKQEIKNLYLNFSFSEDM